MSLVVTEQQLRCHAAPDVRSGSKNERQ